MLLTAPLKNSVTIAIPFEAAFPFCMTPEDVCPYVRHKVTTTYK